MALKVAAPQCDHFCLTNVLEKVLEGVVILHCIGSCLRMICCGKNTDVMAFVSKSGVLSP